MTSLIYFLPRLLSRQKVSLLVSVCKDKAHNFQTLVHKRDTGPFSKL